MHLSTRAAILATAEEVLRDEPTRIIVRARSGRILYWHPVDGETWQLDGYGDGYGSSYGYGSGYGSGEGEG